MGPSYQLSLLSIIPWTLEPRLWEISQFISIQNYASICFDHFCLCFISHCKLQVFIKVFSSFKTTLHLCVYVPCSSLSHSYSIICHLRSSENPRRLTPSSGLSHHCVAFLPERSSGFVLHFLICDHSL